MASTAMYNLSRAWVIVRGQSGEQLAGEAAVYQAVGLDTGFQNIVAHIAFSEDIATEILADALVTPLMDGAVSADDVRALLTQGGSAVLDAAADQVLVRAAGKYLDDNAPDPCDDVDLFRSVHTVAVQNSDIAAANVAANSIPAYRNGIVWSSENKSTAWYDRIKQQGLPYEPYVAQQLGSGYVQLQPNFRVFDQWNVTDGIAVSDKVVDTAGTSYQQYPDTIAARMLAWGEKMVLFQTGGGSDAINFVQNDITSYSLYMAVRDVETTDAEWQAICEGYHALMAFIPTQPGGKQISITIHRVS